MPPGSVVFLKSGGPPMTFTSQIGEAAVVLWFVGDMIQSKEVPLIALTSDNPAITLAHEGEKLKARLSANKE